MTLDWAEMSFHFYVWDLDRLKHFYFYELLPLFEEENMTEKILKLRQDLEHDIRARDMTVNMEGFTVKLDEEGLDFDLEEPIRDFRLDQERLKQEFSSVVSVQIVRLTDRFLHSMLGQLAPGKRIATGRFKELNEAYEATGLPLNSLAHYRDLHILRLINNVYKHGEGDSKVELKRLKPEWFKNREEPSIEPEQIHDFFEKVKSFCHELLTAVKKSRSKVA